MRYGSPVFVEPHSCPEPMIAARSVCTEWHVLSVIHMPNTVAAAEEKHSFVAWYWWTTLCQDFLNDCVFISGLPVCTLLAL